MITAAWLEWRAADLQASVLGEEQQCFSSTLQVKLLSTPASRGTFLSWDSYDVINSDSFTFWIRLPYWQTDLKPITRQDSTGPIKLNRDVTQFLCWVGSQLVGTRWTCQRQRLVQIITICTDYLASTTCNEHEHCDSSASDWSKTSRPLWLKSSSFILAL